MRSLPVLVLVAACNGPGGTDEGTASPSDKASPTDGMDTGTPTPYTTPTECGEDSGFDVLDVVVGSMQGLPTAATVAVSTTAPINVWVDCTLQSAPSPWRELVSMGWSWSYTDDGSDPGGDWMTVGFDDSAWATGGAPLGYGEDVVTTLQGGPGGDAPPATYYRGSFDLADPAAVEDLRLDVRRDDGIVVFLNGTEVARDNVAAGPVDHGTSALVGLTGADAELSPVRFDVSPDLLVAGENRIAVALYQASGSSDAGFDLRLAARVTDNTPEVHLLESASPGAQHDLTLLGLLGDATYACTAQTTCGGADMAFTVQTSGFMVPPPTLARHADSGDPAWGTYTLFNSLSACGSENNHRLVMVDPEGRTRWVYLLQGLSGIRTMDVEAEWLGDDRVLWGGGDDLDGVPQIVTLDHTVAHRAGFSGADEESYHHDVEYLDDGQILGIADGAVTPDGAEYWAGFKLIQHDPDTQEITWEWTAQTGFDSGNLPADGSGDPYHINSLAAVDDVDGAGVYATLLTTSQVIRVDKDSGEVTWKLGAGGDFALVDQAGSPLDDSYWFNGMHAIDVFGDRVFIYENGYGDSRSEVLEFSLDIPNRVATLEWAWSEPRWYEPNWGDADLLPNGNVLVGMGHAWCLGGNNDHMGAFLEIDPATDDVVWRLNMLDSDDSMYRSQQITGCDVFGNTRYCPDVATRLAKLQAARP